MKVLFFVLASTLAIVYSDSPPIFPGFKFKIGDKFLQEVKKINDQLYERRDAYTPSSPLPDGMLPTGVKVKDVKIKEHTMSSSQLKFGTPNLLKYNINNGGLVVEVTLKKDGKEGKATATLAGINLDLALALGISDSHHLSITKDKCQMTIATATVTIDGLTDETELQTFAQNAGQMIKGTLPALLCPQLQMALTLATAQIEQMPNQFPSFEGISVDVSLMNIRATDEFMEFEFLGCPLTEGDTPGLIGTCPSNQIVDSGDTSRMFYISSSESMSNNFLRKMHETNFFSHSIDKNHEKYERVRAGMNKMNEDVGVPLVNANEDFEVSVQSIEAPRVDLSNDFGSPLTTSIKLETTLKVNPGAANEKVMKTRLTANGNNQISINATKEGEMFPRWNEKFELTQLTIDETIGYELTAEQKTKFVTHMTKVIQRFLSKKFLRFEEYNNKYTEQWAKMGRVQNMYFKAGRGTFEVGFDIAVNMDAINTIA